MTYRSTKQGQDRQTHSRPVHHRTRSVGGRNEVINDDISSKTHTQNLYWCSRKMQTYKVTHYVENSIKPILSNKTGFSGKNLKLKY